MAIGQRLGLLFGSAREVATEILVRLCREDRSLLVVEAALEGGGALAASEPEILAPLVTEAFEKAGRDPSAKEVAKGVRSVCLRLSLAMNRCMDNPYAGPIASLVLDDLIGNDDLAAELVFAASGLLLDGPLDPPDPRLEVRRVRSIELLTRMAKQLASECLALNNSWKDKGGWSEKERKQAEISRSLTYQLSIRVQSALEGIGGGQQASDEHEQMIFQPIAARFLREGAALLDTLLTIPLANVIHSVLATLQRLMQCDPGA
jgi:hypothetical protein